MSKIYIINGHAGVGKDTFVSLITELVDDGVTVSNIHSSDPAKAALESLGWNGEKSPEVRTILANLTDISHDNGLSEKMIREAASSDIIFFHERDPKEIRILKRIFPEAKTILVERDGARIEPDKWQIKDYRYDFTVYNNGSLKNLEDEAIAFAEIEFPQFIALLSGKGEN